MKSKRILVVDDAVFITAVIEATLSQAEYQVSIAHSAEEAMVKLGEAAPDLILLDVIMPGMSGFELCEMLRNNPKYRLIPIIIITGQGQEEDRLKGLELGADDYIVKPFVNRELLARVNNTIIRLERMRNLNPMTGLPGNNDIDAEIARRIDSGQPYSVIYFDLNYFKEYNDAYGFTNGDSMIRMTSDVICESVSKLGDMTDFIGHIGGDDFVAICSQEVDVAVAEMVIELFEDEKMKRYNEKDREAGFVYAVDRQNQPCELPLTGIAVAILRCDKQKISDAAELAKTAAELKHEVKRAQKSAYLIG